MGKTKEMNFSFLKKFNFKNLDKALDKIEKGFTAFSKGMNQFNTMMDQMTKELKTDFEKQNKRHSERESRNKENLKKIWGNSENKVWSDKKSKESLF